MATLSRLSTMLYRVLMVAFLLTVTHKRVAGESGKCTVHGSHALWYYTAHSCDLWVTQ